MNQNATMKSGLWYNNKLYWTRSKERKEECFEGYNHAMQVYDSRFQP
jgi:hypothetical protein